MYKQVERAASFLAAVLLFLLMLITFVDVVGRNLINHPLNGASELTEILLASLIFLMLPRVALRNQHIVIDLIENVASPWVLRVLDVFAAVLSAIMFFLISWQMGVLAVRALGYGDSTAALGIPIAPILFGISFMAGIVGVAFLLSTSTSLRDAVTDGDEAHAPVVV